MCAMATPGSASPVVQLTFEGQLAFVSLNRPEKSNAINHDMLQQYEQVFRTINESDARCVVLCGNGKNFCGGLDLQMFGQILGDIGGGSGATLDGSTSAPCEGRKRLRLLATIEQMQRAFEAAERCRVPVIAVVHGACIGGAIDLISACDIVYASRDAHFSVKEVDLGITADMGTLQRLPRRGLPLGVVREWAYTARSVGADEALRAGLVNSVYDTRELALQQARRTATDIAARSPLAVLGSKAVLTHARDHSVDEGLRYVALKRDLHASVMMGDATTLREVIDAGGGTDINAVNSLGKTCLHVAAESGHIECVRILLASGADAARVDAAGKTALDLATEFHHNDIVKLLSESSTGAAPTADGTASDGPRSTRVASMSVSSGQSAERPEMSVATAATAVPAPSPAPVPAPAPVSTPAPVSPSATVSHTDDAVSAGGTAGSSTIAPAGDGGATSSRAAAGPVPGRSESPLSDSSAPRTPVSATVDELTSQAAQEIAVATRRASQLFSTPSQRRKTLPAIGSVPGTPPSVAPAPPPALAPLPSLGAE